MKDTIAAMVAEAEANGHEFMMVVLPERRRGKRWPRQRTRIAPQLWGDLANEQPRASGRVDLVVEVAVADAKAWLRRQGLAGDVSTESRGG